MAAKAAIESGKTNYLHDVEYAVMRATKEDVKKGDCNVFEYQIRKRKCNGKNRCFVLPISKTRRAGGKWVRKVAFSK